MKIKFNFSFGGFSEIKSNIKEFILKWYKYFFLFCLIIIGLLFYNNNFLQYQKYKENYLNNKVLVENQKILKKILKEREEKSNYYETILSFKKREKYEIGDLICFFENFANGVEFVNKEYKIKNFDFDEKRQMFNISIQGIKFYDHLPLILYKLSKTKTIIDLETFSVNLSNEKIGIGEISYYNVNFKGKINNDY